MNYIAMALVEHTKGGQPYLFEVPHDLFVGVGGKVVCQTCRGETLGDIVAVFYEEEKTARYLAIACGGSWPLQKIVGAVNITRSKEAGNELPC